MGGRYLYLFTLDIVCMGVYKILLSLSETSHENPIPIIRGMGNRGLKWLILNRME